MPRWTTNVTREMYFQVLEEWFETQDHLAQARQWLEMGSGSAVELLARQLRKDFKDRYLRGGRTAGDELVTSLFRLGLRFVDWSQVAERLLARTLPRAAAGGEAPPDGAARR
jgi:hypothetical protein